MSRAWIDPLKAYLAIISLIVVLAALAIGVLGWSTATVQGLAWDLAVPLLVITAMVIFVREVFQDLTR
jgi:hypothetical protein